MIKNRWGRAALISTGVLAIIGFAVYTYAPFIGTIWRDDPAPLGHVATGAMAPDFAVQGADGKLHRLSDYRGKTVVLEWTSPTCEFTAQHYDSGNMQKLQKYGAGQGAVWLLVDSSEVGARDYLDPAAAKRRIVSKGITAETLLIDSDGKLGLTYGAVTTPSVYLIDATGRLRYQGAVDDNPWGKGTQDVEHNYLRQALDALSKGAAIPVSETRPYGCSIKYGAGRRALG
jgi:AhpC/TSA family